MPSFGEKHGLKTLLVTSTCIIAGIGKCIGVDVIQIEANDGHCNSDLIKKANIMLEKFSEYDFGFLHIKGVDSAGHEKDLESKIRCIEKADEAIGFLCDSIKEECVIVVTGDHSTLVSSGDHSFEPVPFLLNRLNGNIEKDDVCVFDEISVSQGFLGRFCGGEIMGLIKEYIK